MLRIRQSSESLPESGLSICVVREPVADPQQAFSTTPMNDRFSAKAKVSIRSNDGRNRPGRIIRNCNDNRQLNAGSGHFYR